MIPIPTRKLKIWGIHQGFIIITSLILILSLIEVTGTKVQVIIILETHILVIMTGREGSIADKLFISNTKDGTPVIKCQ